jgi:hypothetical protein
MDRKKERIIRIFFRYIALIFFGIFYSIIYSIFFHLTIWPSYFLLDFFYDVSISENILIVSGVSIGIVSACIAGSAYYLLLILNLTTEMNAKQRAYSLFFSLGMFLVINTLRIFFFSILLIEDYFYFELIHLFFWYLVSIGVVIALWFLTAHLFKIKNFPVYSDVRTIRSLSKK